MSDKSVKEKIKKVLRKDDRLWSDKEKEQLNQTKLFDLVENIDEKVIGLLLEEEELRKKFFTKIKDSWVFNTKDFRFFMEENKINNSYTRYKNRIGLTDGKKFLQDTNDVVLNWPYKDCVLEGGQSNEDGEDTYYEYDEDVTKTNEKKYGHKAEQYNKKTAKRKEIFFNEVLAQDEIDRLFDEKALVNWKRYTKDGEQKVEEIKRDEDGTIKENMIIKGNNLLALHSLKSQFVGKVKLIYIDPPYNTGNDGFKYNDKFNHSTWLTFMKNRLEVAKELLRDDGAIFISIDDDESHYLKILGDEVFGKDQFISNIIRQKKYTIANDARFFSDNHDHILVFCKKRNLFRINGLERTEEQNKRYKNPDDDPNGAWMSQPLHAKSGRNNNFSYTFNNGITWEPPRGTYPRYTKETLKKYEKEDRIWFGSDGTAVPRLKKYLKDMGNITPGTIWLHDNFGNNDQANREVKDLIQNKVFSNPKPEKLLEKIIKIATDKNDLVLDFHLGSGTTAAVCQKIGRQYIGIEQMDYIKSIACERLKEVILGEQGGISESAGWKGGGEFVYCELAERNKQAKERLLESDNFEQLLEIFDEVYEKYFLNYNIKIKEFREKIVNEKEFKKLPLEKKKEMVINMLDLNQMYVNRSEVTDKKFGISKKNQNLSNKFYS